MKDALSRIIASGGQAVAGWDINIEMGMWSNVRVLSDGRVEVSLPSIRGEFSLGCSLEDFSVLFGATLVKVDITGQRRIAGDGISRRKKFRSLLLSYSDIVFRRHRRICELPPVHRTQS
jgi:hypothetical protein